jgi:hypothetical protein
VGTAVAVLGLSVWVVTALAERRRRRATHRPIATPGDLVLLSGATVVVGLVLFVLAAWPG